MRHAIETAPRDGKVVILVDDARETWGIAYWSLEAGEWVGRDGKPSRITPTHWHPFSHDNGSSTLSQVGPSARRRRSNYFAAAAAATLIGLLFYATLDTRQPGEQVVARGNQLPSQNSRIGLPASDPTEANHANASEEAQQVRQVALAAAPEAEQSLKRERAQALAQELTEAEARRIIEELDAQLRAKAAKGATLLEQEREKTAALVQEELTTRTAKHRQALDEERERRAALWSELAAARREIEMQAAQLRKASETEQLKQAEATESATLLEQEREKTAALVQEELTTSTAKHQRALDEGRARLPAMGSELATQRSSPIPRKPPRLNRGHNARQSWGPVLWLWGLDPGAASRWERTTHVSMFGLRPPRSSSRRQPAG
jgi:hypothetical protein